MEKWQSLIAYGGYIVAMAFGFLLRRELTRYDKLCDAIDLHSNQMQQIFLELAGMRGKFDLLKDMEKHYHQFFGREKDTMWEKLDQTESLAITLDKKLDVLAQKLEDMDG